MTRDVIVSISGIQVMADVGETVPIELITNGIYYKKNGKHYVLYGESFGEQGPRIRNTLKISDQRVDMIKTGESNSHMVFEPEKKNVTYYHTPYGSLLVNIFTLEISHEEEERMLCTHIRYTMELNGSAMTDCTIEIRIKAVEEAVCEVPAEGAACEVPAKETV